MSSHATQLLPGLADRVFDSQRVFRAALEALSRPGQVVRIGVALRAPPPLESAAAALLLTLADFETSIWMQEPRDAVSRYLRFHSGATIVESPHAARFAVITDPVTAPELDAFAMGEPEYPDRSTTLIVQVPDFTSGSHVELSGPGVGMAIQINVGGLSADFWRQWACNHTRFPCGIDVIFVIGNAIMGLPRTTRAELLTCMFR